MASTWSDEEKQEVITAYTDANPTPETSTEIIRGLAEDFDKTANGIRMILVKAEVYVKKAQASGTSSNAAATGDKPARVSKSDSQDALTAIIESNGLEADPAIIEKLTGKAAQYLADIMTKISERE